MGHIAGVKTSVAALHTEEVPKYCVEIFKMKDIISSVN